MRTAIYIEDGTTQIVLTPETEHEKKALFAIQDKPMEAKIHYGSFYHCQGGWVRESRTSEDGMFGGSEPQSLMIVAALALAGKGEGPIQP
jgi:hypothetical protein